MCESSTDGTTVLFSGLDGALLASEAWVRPKPCATWRSQRLHCLSFDGFTGMVGWLKSLRLSHWFDGCCPRDDERSVSSLGPRRHAYHPDETEAFSA